jgi:NDP-sugar pyrophosphorylase family protein
MDAPLVVILAGGTGTRLGALAEGLPKPMVPVAGRPFLEHLLRQLSGQGFREALLLTGYKAEMIEAHFGRGERLGMDLRYSREPEPLGTGGAFRLARNLIQGRFLMMYGDLYRPVDYAALARGTRGNALAVYPYVDGLTTIDSANVGLDAAGERVLVYAKAAKDPSLTHVDAGFGFFEPEVIDRLPQGTSSFERTIFPALAEEGALGAIAVDRNFLDIGNPSDLADARNRLSSMIEETP